MPNYFKLIDKTTEKPAKFVDIDEKLCVHMGVEPHPKNYLYGWYDFIGLGLAMGKTFDELRGFVHKDEQHIHKVIDYLDEHYVPDAWYQPK